MDKAHDHYLPVIALSLSSLFWSGNFIVGRGLRDVIDPLPLNFWRWSIALAVLLPFSIGTIRAGLPLVRRHWKFIIVLSISGIAGFHLCVYRALQTTTAINALLFLSITPVLIILGSRLAFNEPIRGRQILGILLSLAGVIALLSHGKLQRLHELTFNHGDIWMLFAVSLWAVYSILLRRKPADLNQALLLNSTIGSGVLIMMPFYLVSLSTGLSFTLTPGVIGGLAYISLFASLAAYYCWNYGVDRLGPNKAGAFLHLMPLFGAVLSVLLLAESIQLYHLAGACLIATGLVLTNRLHSR